MLFVKQIRLPLSAPRDAALAQALRVLGAKHSEVRRAEVSKVSVDARRGRPSLVYTVAVELWDEGAELSYEGFAPSVSLARPLPFTIPRGAAPLAERPVVCGLGPAGLFAALVWRGIVISSRAKDRFGAMLCVGLVLQVGIQAVLNIMVVTNTIPNTGISLPFFSYGGTSLIMLLAQMGVVLSISRSAVLKQ